MLRLLLLFLLLGNHLFLIDFGRGGDDAGHRCRRLFLGLGSTLFTIVCGTSWSCTRGGGGDGVSLRLSGQERRGNIIDVVVVVYFLNLKLI